MLVFLWKSNISTKSCTEVLHLRQVYPEYVVLYSRQPRVGSVAESRASLPSMLSNHRKKLHIGNRFCEFWTSDSSPGAYLNPVTAGFQSNSCYVTTFRQAVALETFRFGLTELHAELPVYWQHCHVNPTINRFEVGSEASDGEFTWRQWGNIVGFCSNFSHWSLKLNG